LHFGGEGLKSDSEDGDLFTVKKTREQVFAEIMLKSKYYKEKRIEQKEENEDIVEKLDDELESLMPLLDKKRSKFDRLLNP
jgi:hypothetical protein